MILIKIRFHYLNNWVEVNNQIFIIYSIPATCFWLVNQESGFVIVYIVNVKLLQYLLLLTWARMVIT